MSFSPRLAIATHCVKPRLARCRLSPQPLRTFSTTTPQLSSHPSPTASATPSSRKKVTIGTLNKLWRQGTPITMLTAYDYPSALLADRAGMETVLVGDSLAMVALGYENTNRITLDEMLHHCRAVSRGSRHAFLIGDLPFGTYETSPSQAITSATRMIREGRMEAVKLEGGTEMQDTISSLTRVGISVLGHVGLTPQRATSLGGFRVQGKTAAGAVRLLKDALAVQEAGAFAVVIEAVPELVATELTKRLKIPTIGIGAGSGCSGQVLVGMDMLGVYDKLQPKFCKTYAEVGKITVDAYRAFGEEVKHRTFPVSEVHTYPMGKEEEAKFLEAIKNL
ncbi:ketopantoate hydroxymethyltransferase-domain-containing protein [Fimicolochytrium jonesii]|uniref:ketopantoate hydroxymethyltransferase-domain-containing protein n=1 Tax=Fimicolochytrium jonesii TaxID=1396493 RepID=UPI0022FEFCDB|nr:ketopantoate hydroxymethyltransferase-domain-containing protein [Fimicolochytrium jonesii]KAI8826756.1 ketopantoate hydroxymethyltransferase-domain-containing protein [Fimicolochytrium jonesii]